MIRQPAAKRGRMNNKRAIRSCAEGNRAAAEENLI